MQKVSMRYSPWPHEMVMTIEDNATQLFELLWIRETFGLRPAGDVPPLLVDGPVSAGGPGSVGGTDDAQAWQQAWHALWDAAVTHAAGVVAPGQLERLGGMAGGSPELAEALRGCTDPTGATASTMGHSARISAPGSIGISRRGFEGCAHRSSRCPSTARCRRSSLPGGPG